MLNRRHETQQDAGQGTDRDWRSRAACLGTDPELFFPAADSGPVRDEQVAEAKAVCAGCPVLDVCRAWAVEALPIGVAGGLTEQERRTLRAAARPSRATRVVEPPVGGSRREVTAAGRAAAATGEPVLSVARRFGVDVRTVYHWRAATTATTSDAVAGGGAR